MPILDEELYQAGMAIAACPTAPCHEGHVRGCLLERLAGLPHVATRLDEFGNLHAVYDHESAGREPFRLVAHMDHPAFLVERTGNKATLRFAGGVEGKYFAGKKIIFHHEETSGPLGRATIRRVDFSGETGKVKIDGEIPSRATFARWDLSPARCTKRLFISPACDDLVQVAAILALLRRLSHDREKACVHALFTRAEEIGFAGALAALKSRPPPEPIVTLSLEASRARGFARVEGGPVVRVGDRLSTFDSRVTHWLETGFRALAAKKKGAVYQRLLMGGGTCEASVFLRAGWPTGALCVALNNYHNMGPGTSIRSESISLRDWQGLYDFLFFLATEAPSLSSADGQVAERFARLEAKALAALQQTKDRAN
jgi:endoglucanase